MRTITIPNPTTEARHTMIYRLKTLPPAISPAVLLALVLALATASCQDQAATDETAGTYPAATDTAAAGADAVDAEAATAIDTPVAAPGVSDPVSAGTRAALPRLFSIMVGLQGDMERISRGIWTESYDSIAVAARAVADHPMMGAEGIAKIQSVLGDDMARFKGMDTNVHDLAVEVEELAGAGDLDAVVNAEARLRQGCVECHTAFRDRLREAF